MNYHSAWKQRIEELEDEGYTYPEAEQIATEELDDAIDLMIKQKKEEK